MWKTIVNAFSDKEIRKRIFLTLGMLILFRIGCFIPLPGINVSAIETSLEGNSFMELMSIMTGGALSQGTLFSLGILPFINSFIIMQLLTIIIPKLAELSKGDQEGRKKYTQITRYVAIVLAVIQGIGICVGWKDAFQPTFGSTIVTMITVIIMLTAGSTLVMWLGERITEYGIGNGTSLIIFVGIISTAGVSFLQACQIMSNDPVKIWLFVGFVILIVALFFFIVYVDLAERRIPVSYGGRSGGSYYSNNYKTHIPLRVNASGVMPIIFATSILMFPMMLGSLIPTDASAWWNRYLGVGTVWYYVILIPLIIFFAYFYSQIQFNPIEVAINIYSRGGRVIPFSNARDASDYLKKINNRIVLFGALFLGFIAIIPAVGFKFLGEDIGLNNAFSATGLLIIVSVALELNKQLEAQIMNKQFAKVLG